MSVQEGRKRDIGTRGKRNFEMFEHQFSNVYNAFSALCKQLFYSWQFIGVFS